MKRTIYTFLTAVLIPAIGTFAQDGSAALPSDSTKANKVNELTVGLNLMTHGEIIRGGLPEDNSGDVEDESNFLMGRLRLNVDYKRRGLELHTIIQNLAVWGSSGSQALNLYEGWAKFTAKCGLFGQVGRIALSYDDERIIGPNDFAMASQSHDVLRVGYEGHGHKVHAMFGYNQNADNVYLSTYYSGGSQYYKTMQTLWYHYDVPKFPLGASLLFMNFGLQAGEAGNKYNEIRTVYQQLFGGYVNFHPKYVTVEGAYYKQIGKTVDEEMRAADINAWMASGKVTIKPSDRYGFHLGYDYLSGDDYVAVVVPGHMGLVYHKEAKGFNPLYGSRTKFYGIMDYFYESAYINGFTPGLQNAFFGVLGNPFPKFNCSATYHYLAVTTELKGLGRTLGHSLEIELGYRFSTDISISGGYTLMHGTETMNRLKQDQNNEYAHWAWLSLVISPKLFTTRF